jgi:hypothetical protein
MWYANQSKYFTLRRTSSKMAEVFPAENSVETAKGTIWQDLRQ